MATIEIVRRERGLSYPKLAVRAGVSTSTAWRACQGRDVSFSNASKIAQALGVNLTDLLAA